MKTPKNYTLFWVVLVGLLIIDQASKYIVQQSQFDSLHGVLWRVWDGLQLVYVENTGAAWGVMAGSGPLLGLLAVAALGCIYLLRVPLQLSRGVMQVAFGLLSAGITGNMLDRLFLGYVVDFVDWTIFGFRFPAFNVADMGITIGVALYILFSSMPTPRKSVSPVQIRN